MFTAKFLSICLLLLATQSIRATCPCICQHQQNEIKELHASMLKIPKSELHLHLGGAWPLNYLKEVAKPREWTALQAQLHTIHCQGVDYNDVFSIFDLINAIMCTDERIEKGTAALVQQLADDYVTYAELRTGLKDLGSGYEGYLNAVLRGINTEKRIKCGVLLSMRRDTPPHLAELTIDLALKYRTQGVVGIDISGNSSQGDSTNLESAIIRAQMHKLPITLHIGELATETPEKQMYELTIFQPARIGHGVHLCEAAQVWIRQNRIPIELCLTSALKTGMVTYPEEHPALLLLLEGHPVAICTDDPLLFNSTLSQEFAKIASLLKLLPHDIQRLQQNVSAYAFMP